MNSKRRFSRTALLVGVVVVLAGGAGVVSCRSDERPSRSADVHHDDDLMMQATTALRVGSAATSASVRLLLDSDHPIQDVFVRSTPFGVEDFVVIDRPENDRGFLEYVLTLNAWTKGLRLVERSLELLDQNGAPRIRMQAPYLVDGHDDHERRRSIRDID